MKTLEQQIEEIIIDKSEFRDNEDMSACIKQLAKLIRESEAIIILKDACTNDGFANSAFNSSIKGLDCYKRATNLLKLMEDEK